MREPERENPLNGLCPHSLAGPGPIIAWRVGLVPGLGLPWGGLRSPIRETAGQGGLTWKGPVIEAGQSRKMASSWVRLLSLITEIA